MCGIAGWIGTRNPETLNRMRAALRHRGPDEEGEYVRDEVTLIHQRLSIIDLASGQQPMSSEDGRYTLVYNGEVYNYLALRDYLESKGHVFRTKSDTEVVLRLYMELGADCCAQLQGMFAFVVWDRDERRLFLARDRIGIKPLFYTECDGGLVFGSELNTVLAHHSVERTLDTTGLDHYLTFMYVPAPRTIIKGVHKLQPGHTLTWKDGRTEIRRYWRLPSAAASCDWSSEQEGSEQLEAMLQEAVGCRLMSEVPLGAYLSGGLDSSLVVGMMSRASRQAVSTFSVGFEERGFDERPYSQLIAKTFSTDHHELVVGHHSADEFPGIIRALDEPVADSAAIPTFFMAEVTKPNVTVVLTGEGADELFAGYSHYKLLSWFDRLAWASPGRAGRWVAKMFGSGRLGRGFEYVGSLRNRAGAYLALKSVFTPAEKASLYSSGLRDGTRTITPPEAIVEQYLKRDDGDYLNQLLRLDMATWLADDLLVKVDRMTMAHAVEARVPFLDHRVVDAVMRMPAEWKLRGAVGKHLLRDVAARIIPQSIVERKKTGFAVPVGQWAAGEMGEWVAELLGAESVRNRGLFEPKAVAKLVGRSGYTMFQRRQLWTLLTLEMWCRENLD
jgi:asparagine synthase (glutamine-hydrolysing)